MIQRLHIRGGGWMQQADDGRYVDYDDHVAALESQLAALRQQREAMVPRDVVMRACAYAAAAGWESTSRKVGMIAVVKMPDLEPDLEDEVCGEAALARALAEPSASDKEKSQ